MDIYTIVIHLAHFFSYFKQYKNQHTTRKSEISNRNITTAKQREPQISVSHSWAGKPSITSTGKI